MSNRSWCDVLPALPPGLRAALSCSAHLCSPFQILLPLINQYFTNHCLYFLSTPAKILGSGGHASNKEKEMITR